MANKNIRDHHNWIEEFQSHNDRIEHRILGRFNQHTIGSDIDFLVKLNDSCNIKTALQRMGKAINLSNVFNLKEIRKQAAHPTLKIIYHTVLECDITFG